MGPIAHLGYTETLWRETGSLLSHIGETVIPIGETELIRVSGYGYVKWTRWRRIDQIGGVEFDFRFRTYVWESGWGFLEHTTKHFEQLIH